MTDRVPGAPGRCKAVVTGEDLQKMQSGEEFAITLRRDDAPVKEGTPYNKATVLPDELAEQLCPELQDPAPKDAFAALQAQKADTGRRKTGSIITLDDAANAPLLGLKIYGRDTEEVVVGDSGSVTVNVTGKNIADVWKYSADSRISTPTSATPLSNSHGTTISATAGDSITVTQSKASGTATSYMNGFFSVGFYAPLKVGDTVTISCNFKVTENPLNAAYFGAFLNGQPLSQSWVTTALRSWTVKITESMAPADNWNFLEIRIGGKSGVFSNFQIEYGNAYTGYSPYQEILSVTVPTPNSLLGNDDFCDEIDFAKGVLIGRCRGESEEPLPDDVLEAYRKLRSYAPVTYITNNYNAEMEVHYCTQATAVPMIYNPNDRGKYLSIDDYGSVSLRRMEACVELIEKTDGWNCRAWSDGFVELYLSDTESADEYPGACYANYVLPFPMRSDSMVQVTVAGKAFLHSYSLTNGTELHLQIETLEAGTYLHLSAIQIHIAGYMTNA